MPSDGESVLVAPIYPVPGPLEPWVREAVDRGVPESQLELHYQPIVRLDGSGVYGAETFLRWRQPERGVLRAGQWIPYAIESGAAVGLNVAVLPLWSACARRLPGLALGRHVTRQDLSDEQYMASMHAVAGGGAAGLAVEVHSVEFHADVNLDAGLASLRTLGVRVWLNDFGCDGVGDATVGPGSDVEVVKLAMALLGWERGRLTALVERLHDHGMLVLAEGVESAAHEHLAVDAGIDLASGYRYARPLAEQQFVEYLSS